MPDTAALKVKQPPAAVLELLGPQKPSSLDCDAAAAVLHEYNPNLDPIITNYILSFLCDPTSEAYDENGVKNFLTPLLTDVFQDESVVDAVCKEFDALIPFAERVHIHTGPVMLDTPMDMSAFAGGNVVRLTSATDLEWVTAGARKGVSMVDERKLEKAERKIREKMAKRDRKNNLYEESKLLKRKDDQNVIKAVNPILDYTTTRGKSKDIKLDAFDISFAGKRILTDANLTLAFGRRYGLIGRNGIGKSTLLRNIARRDLPVPDQIAILHVEQELAGDDTPAVQAVLRSDEFREHLLKEEARLTEAMNAITGATEADDQNRSKFAKELEYVHGKLLDIESDKAESKAAAILRGLGFRQWELQQATKAFSGGWRMRLALAQALFRQPDLLLLDEPTNMLDIPAVAWLESYLQTWPTTLLVVSHDREFLDNVCTDIIHQHSERLDAYKGNFTQFECTRSERKKQMKREYDAQMQYRKHLEEYIAKWRYNAARAAQAQMKIKILEKLPILEPVEEDWIVTFRFPNPDGLSPPIMQASDVTFHYPGSDRIILEKVNFDLQLDSRIAIVGSNGSGKSTLLKLLTGHMDPTTGMVHQHSRLRVAYFTQHHVDQLELDISAVGYLAKRFPGKPEEEYRRALGRFGLSGMIGLQQIRTLSGGQKSRVAFAILALQNPHVLVLDEPTNHLDMDSIEALTKACQEFGGGIVLVSHDERFIDAVCTEIWVCKDKKVEKFYGEGIKDYKKWVLKDIESS